MSLEKRQAVISRDNLDSQVAALLYAFGFVNDDEHVVDIEYFPTMTDTGEVSGEIPLTFTVRRGSKEVNIVKSGERT